MPTWNAGQYLRFADERTRACRDLAARVTIPDVRRAIDLGCGPGNSTQVIAERWPSAELIGLDSSVDMIAKARDSQPDRTWIGGDIATWAASRGEQFDLVFSNAALQWVPDHAGLFPKLLSRVAKGGAFAMQMPGNFDAPAHQAMRELAASAAWRDKFPAGTIREWHAHEPGFYYDTMAPHAGAINLWETTYFHVMEGPRRSPTGTREPGCDRFWTRLPPPPIASDSRPNTSNGYAPPTRQAPTAGCCSPSSAFLWSSTPVAECAPRLLMSSQKSDRDRWRNWVRFVIFTVRQ